MKAILFDLGGVLLPFDRERRVAAIVDRLGVAPDAVRAIFDGDMPRRLDCGEVDEGDFAATFSAIGNRPVSAAEVRELLLSVFEPPNLELWALADALRPRMLVGGFSDNPAFVRQVFPTGYDLDPMIFSAEIGASKPSAEAFSAAEAILGLRGEAIAFVDDSAANVEAASRRGWDAVQFRSNRQLKTALRSRSLL